ncbi:tryptophan--tRNA ligase [Microlunatus soli]|uniref:Tryptophan--tRNA ligase n=1 Tax=Microlunatus soli TaxID=630515 RepID=A0A1H1Z9X7_9ACTN|nr:tryptophan--tRNA ligase [Microlunatus soli]SDT29996.1 tryptophanyl-tRNA synthetase [Microlunatus soli]
MITEPTTIHPSTGQPTSTGVQLSLLTPSGHLTIGNYIGALAPMREARGDCYFGVSDLHAMTMPHDRSLLRERTAEFQRLMLAVGLDPVRQVLFRQSAVPEHTGLHYLLECVARVGELGRMIQFKEKGRDNGETRMSLLSYPVLMSADILLYQAAEVPVGQDQSQHVELARDLAQRFNRDYPGQDGPVFTVPVTVNPPVAARLRDLQRPTIKMSKSATNPAGVIYLLDGPDAVRRKIRRAVTDSEPGISYQPDRRPGLANLLELVAACAGRSVTEVADDHDSFGSLKATAADAVIATLEPIQRRYAELAPDQVDAVFAAGAERARSTAGPTLAAARQAIGL